MMSDLVKNIKQLRDYSEGPTSLWGPICYAAADALEQQQARIEELEALIQYAIDRELGTLKDTEKFEAALQENE